MACFVLSCKSHASRKDKNDEFISFHRMPLDDIGKENWYKVIPRARNNWRTYSRICSKHFIDKCFVSKDKWRRLKPGSIPSLLLALREKEKGDWKLLCCEEKKTLYRASFCQTFAEFQAPTGQWKFIMGWVLFFTSAGFWGIMFSNYYVNEPLPISLSQKSQKAQLRRMIELRVNPIDGLSSLWDYDNDRWKGQGSK